MKYIKSPLNYIGGKYSLLEQILPLFPKNIDVFIDLFGGGGNIGVNVTAKKIVINDMNHKIVELFQYLQQNNIEDILNNIDYIIKQYNLSKTNEEGFLKLRDSYNNNPHPLKLYVLISYSYNYQFRFNNNLEYNSSFGRNRSSFTKNMRTRLMLFTDKIQKEKVVFTNFMFEDYNYQKLTEKDFVYCDPPYLITTGNYNDGNRGFKNWCEESDILLMNKLDSLDDSGVKWAMSNVLEHKGEKNHRLYQWTRKYNVHLIEKNYNNSSYNSQKGNTKEVVITNY